MSYCVVLGKADSLPPLNSDSDDQEDTGRQGEVTAALKEGENEGDEAVVEAEVKGQNNEIGEEEDNVSNTETGEESVKQVELVPVIKDSPIVSTSDGTRPVIEDKETDTVTQETKEGEEGGENTRYPQPGIRILCYAI